uniref:uncharacterized protein LOC109956182 isoform X1 n=1 Tax=Monopterus albus TaxID=43700 RepID=UPI0009B4DCE5|nr:uncharacterized protein LOC109956182 isoform X1 [Monopterus albus]
MTSCPLLLSILVLLSFFSTAWCIPTCNNQCCRFVESFPVRLRKLREDYSHIRDFYVSKSSSFALQVPLVCSIIWTDQVMLHFLTFVCLDLLTHSLSALSTRFFCLQEANNDLDTALLDQTVEDSFKSPFACQVMRSLLDFYLNTVLPTAVAGVTEDTKDLRPHMESIQLIFDQLKSDVTKCVSS